MQKAPPIPAVMKFVANKPLVPQSVEFKNIDEAKNAPLAQTIIPFTICKRGFLRYQLCIHYKI